MFFNPRSLVATALLGACAIEASPLARPVQFVPVKDPSKPSEIGIGKGLFTRDAQPAPVDMIAIPDPGVFTGRPQRRAVTGKEAFDPESVSTFYWGAYAADNIYIANFTMENEGDDEMIMPIEKFSKELKSIKCGNSSITLEFKDQDSFEYASSAWDWVNKEDINRFTLVTEPDQCYKGDNRSPYLVSSIKFDKTTLAANIQAQEKEWADVAHTFELKLRHEKVNPTTANVTHPHLFRRENSDLDIGHTFNGELFNFAVDSTFTPGMAMSANLELTTAGHIAADFDIKKKSPFCAFGKCIGPEFIPEDVSISINPQDVNALMKLTLHADGQLGRALDWSMSPEIDIPIAALNIAKILQIGPFVTLGVHFGSSALTGTGDIVTGAKGTLDNSAKVHVQVVHPDQNSFEGNWTPTIDKIDPTFSAEFTGDLRAWAELAFVFKVEALGRWGYQAGIEAQVPYYQANLVATKAPTGVCGTKKTVGIDVDTNVGIDLSLQAGPVNGAPNFSKDLWTTNWPLFTTCLAVGDDNAVTATATDTAVATETGNVTATATGTEAVPTDAPTGTESEVLDTTAVETGTDVVATGEPTATDSMITGTETGTEVIETGEPTATDSGILDTTAIDTTAVETGTDVVDPTGTEVLDTSAIQTDSPTLTDGADAPLPTDVTDGVPSQTIYKTIYITRGGDEEGATTTDEFATETTDIATTDFATTDELLPTETSALDTLASETDVATTAIDSELPLETTTALDSEIATTTGDITDTMISDLPTETGATATDIPSETSLPVDTMTTGLPSETLATTDLPSETLATTDLPSETLATDLPSETLDTAVPSETLTGTVPVDTGLPSATATAGITGPGTGLPPLMNATMIAPPSTMQTMVSSVSPPQLPPPPPPSAPVNPPDTRPTPPPPPPKPSHVDIPKPSHVDIPRPSVPAPPPKPEKPEKVDPMATQPAATPASYRRMG